MTTSLHVYNCCQPHYFVARQPASFPFLSTAFMCVFTVAHLSSKITRISATLFFPNDNSLACVQLLPPALFCRTTTCFIAFFETAYMFTFLAPHLNSKTTHISAQLFFSTTTNLHEYNYCSPALFCRTKICFVSFFETAYTCIFIVAHLDNKTTRISAQFFFPNEN
jgi:hypothetical protein